LCKLLKHNYVIDHRSTGKDLASRCPKTEYFSQNVKKRKDECVQLLENIHQLLYAIINLHIKSAGTMSPENLYEIARFTEYVSVIVGLELHYC
jgi:hypothetical protein